MDPSSAKYPLSDAKLPKVNVGAATLAKWKAEAQSIVHHVVRNRQSWYYRFQDYQYMYKPMYAKHGTHGCARVVKDTKLIEFMSRSELTMTLDELEYGLHCETNAEQRAVYAQLYQSSCLDGALLNLFEGKKAEDPFHSVSAKWIALRSPMKKIFSVRDFVYFEYCFTTTDADGRTVLIEYKKSKAFRSNEFKDHDLDITRGSMYVLNTYYMENDRVIMQSLGEHDVAGSFPVWFALAVTPIMFERNLNYYGLADSRALAEAGLRPSCLAGKRPEASIACHSCNKKFKMTRRKKWCRGCGHAVCRDCVMKVVMYKDEVETSSRLPYVRERFCLTCLIYVRELRATVNYVPKIDLTDDYHRETNPASKFAQSQITAAVHSMDRILDLEPRQSTNESLNSLDMLDEGSVNVLMKPNCSQRTTQSTSICSVTTESSSAGSTGPIYAESVDLVDMARIVADQAALLRSIYQEREKHQRRLYQSLGSPEYGLSDMDDSPVAHPSFTVV